MPNLPRRPCPASRGHSNAAGRREKKFKTIPNTDLAGVAVQFYTRQELDDTGYEFIHKSFGEYLIARALLAAAERAKDRLDDTNEETTAREWLEICGAAEITGEIVRFLRDEVRRLTLDETRALKDALQGLMSWTLRSGMPAHALDDTSSFRSAEARQRHAEGALLAVLNACARRIAEEDQDAAMVRLNWPDDHAMRYMIERLQITRWTIGPMSTCLSHLLASAAEVVGATRIHQSLHTLDLFQANLQAADLKEAQLAAANLRGASLAGANLEDANLAKARLGGANLRAAILQGAHLRGADLQGADLQGAHLQGAHLHYADLSEAVDLSQEQINTAYGNAETWLPEGLEPPSTWLEDME